MAVFSDLPNELVMHIWSYVIEPESVERFALVSKNIYGLAAPFLREHARLKRKYSRLHYSHKSQRAADLLRSMLLNPRAALYINEIRIVDWAEHWEEQYQKPLLPYSRGTMKLFKDVVLSSSLIPPSEVGNWVKIIKEGDEAPILALIIMQTTKLTTFELDPSYAWSDYFVNEALGRVGSLQPSRFCNISDLSFYFSEIDLGQLSGLLRGPRELKSFTFFGDHSSVIQPFQICSQLLASSQHSLQKLNLQTDQHLDNGKMSYMGDITCFTKLTALETDFFLLLGSVDSTCRKLADVVPISIERVTLNSTEAIPSETIKEVVSEMVKSKTDRLRNLKALAFKFDGREWVDPEQFTDLEKKSVDVGVLLSTIPCC